MVSWTASNEALTRDTLWIVYPAPKRSLCVETRRFLLAFEPRPVTAMAVSKLELSVADAGGVAIP